MSRRVPCQAVLLPVLALLALSIACAGPAPHPEESDTQSAAAAAPRTFAPEAEESHLGELRMLTDGGENAEAYFSFSGNSLIFQSTRPPFACDQIFAMGIDGSDQRLVSTGKGRTTCAYFYPDGQHILYSSTHLASPDCPPKPDFSHGYVWRLDPGYDIFRANRDGSDLQPLTRADGYDAEATISPRGDRIVFTSARHGDLDIYTMNLDGSDLRRLTEAVGYDGGPFFSPDGSKIVYRAHHPTDPEEIADYRALLADGLIRPSKLEIWVMDADGSNKRQITHLDAASFAPFFFPSGKRIIFSSNHGDPAGREFELWAVDVDGSNLERITHSEGFDGFPMFGPDGHTFVFCSNRHDREPGETNVFVTTWRQ